MQHTGSEKPPPARHRAGAPAIAATLLGAIAACTPPRSASDPFASFQGAPGFDAAREACIDGAVARSANLSGQATASKAAIGMFLDCMAGKGFAPADGAR